MKPRKVPPPRKIDDAEAFLVPGAGALLDDEAEAIGEEFLAAVTSAEYVEEDARNELADEEIGLVPSTPAPDEIDVQDQ